MMVQSFDFSVEAETEIMQTSLRTFEDIVYKMLCEVCKP